jgi:hypothetical protein
MRDDDRRNSAILEEVAVQETVLAAVAEELDRRSKLEHARSRLRKLLRRRPMWPHFMQRTVNGSAEAPS